MASFKYAVKGNDGTEYTGRVEVLVEKVTDSADSGEQPGDSTKNTDSTTVAAGDSSATGTVATDSSKTSMTDRRALDRNRLQLPTRRQGFRDLNGRHYSKQVPYRVMF